jgi:A/G-specific adenine glycosylase
LLAWYHRQRRDLPWRRTRDPYRVWVSEVMLQQTQVATAIPFYERFVARFPDVRALASAGPDEVLAAWAGLGYYRRARHLHEAAVLVVREHAGRIPSEPDAFGALPGVGRYTMGAVLSIGFGAALPVLDGNVARVIARLTARPLAVKRPADARVLWSLAEAMMPCGRVSLRDGTAARGPRAAASDPGDWNQALMELGATVCTPRAPRCEACPVRRHCRAWATGQQATLPPVAARRSPVAVRRAVVRIEHRGRVLMSRRTGALLDGLWEPPGVELARGDDAGAALARVLAGLRVRASMSDTRVRVRHSITHRDITVQVWSGKLTGRAPRATARVRWVDPAAPEVALTALAKRVAVGLMVPARRQPASERQRR